MYLFIKYYIKYIQNTGLWLTILTLMAYIFWVLKYLILHILKCD